MIYLISANFHSMVRSKRFWVGWLAMISLAILDAADRVQISFYRGNSNVTMYDSYASLAIWLFLIAPALGGLFINTDYHDGTIRNKITVGRSRAEVYLANLITVYAATVAYFLLPVGINLLLGTSLGVPLEDPGAVAGSVCQLLPVYLALAAITTMLASLIAHRSVLLVVVFVAFAMFFGGFLTDALLQQPDMIEDYGGVAMTTDEEGNTHMEFLDKNGNPIPPDEIPTVPNPDYIRDPLRTFLRVVNTVQPGGQLNEITDGGHREYDAEQGSIVTIQTPPALLAAYSLATAAVFTIVGLILFKKKDLK